MNPTQRQTTYSLFAPPLGHRVRRERQAVGVQNDLRRALDHLPVLACVYVALLNQPVQELGGDDRALGVGDYEDHICPVHR